MSNDEKNNLKLVGENEEDLKIISAYLQDSVVIAKDIIFLAGGGIIIVTSEVIEVFMEDLNKPWNVKYIPRHQI